MTRVVVVGVDGSEGSQRALRWAADEARVRNACLRVVYAWSYLSQPEGFDPAYGEHDARRVIDDTIQLSGVDVSGVDVDRRLICDLPARALLQEAVGADLLVVGARGLGGFQGLLLGSVSQQVVQHAPCPVVIVPGDERRSA